VVFEDYADMKARIDAGEIGRPLLVHSVHRNASVHAWFDSEMIVKDTVVHDVDLVRWLLGDEIVRATAFSPRPTSRAADGVQDPQFIVLESEAGAVIDVEAYVNAQYGYDIRCEVVGESGTLALAAPATVVLHREGRGGIELPPRFQERFAAAYTAELEAWVASIATGTPAGASAWDGYAAAAVCEAAFDALSSGQPAEVRLAARPALYAAADELVGRG
jgi:myo-inositol 2-dehydrogenase/D-chiro-inositol 1-dehydrogenase